jgi:hypothetical protein
MRSSDGYDRQGVAAVQMECNILNRREHLSPSLGVDACADVWQNRDLAARR